MSPGFFETCTSQFVWQWLILIRTCSLFGQVIQLQCDQMLELKTSPQLVNVAQKVANEALP